MDYYKNAMVHGTLLVPCTIAFFRKTKGIEWVCVDTYKICKINKEGVDYGRIACL